MLLHMLSMYLLAPYKEQGSLRSLPLILMFNPCRFSLGSDFITQATGAGIVGGLFFAFISEHFSRKYMLELYAWL